MSQKINLSEEVIWQLTSKMKESVIITTTDLDSPGPIIVHVNDYCCKMTGYTAEELIGKNPRMFQGPNTDMSVMARLKNDLLKSGEFCGGVAINYKKDGTEYNVEWDIITIKDSSSNPLYYMAIQRDMTDIRKARIEIEELNIKIKNMILHYPQ